MRAPALLHLALAAGLAASAPARTRCPGNVPAQVRGARDLGPAPDGRPMERMILVLKPPPGARERLDRLLAELQDPASGHYHRWLTPAQFGAACGPAPDGLERVTGWLDREGFRVDRVAAGRLAVTFSGTVAQVRRAFRTPIRRFLVDGQEHQANLGEPAIPRELADLVEGVVSLHDFPRPAPVQAAAVSGHSLAPADFAVIYGLAPLYRAGWDGTGVTIAVAGRSHIRPGDPERFRARFNLPERPPEILVDGPDPGALGGSEDLEADLDVEWAGAVARNATVRLVVAASTAATDGADLSALYIVDHDLAPVLSTSFGQCEQHMGAAALAFYKNLWAQAAAQGITVLAAAGDSGAAGCDAGAEGSGSGRAVSGLASTPYNVAVGGTELEEGGGSYWRDRPDAEGALALGYIPERAWNESGLVPGGSGLWAGGGGLSTVTPRPAWQQAPGLPAGAAYRCLPDVALTAAHHDGYRVQSGGVPLVAAGTSCACPAFAGVMALLVQKTGQRQGNAGPELYRLGRAQYGGQGPVVFHDVVQGDNSVPGTPGYPCGSGYDLATGLGSLDGAALAQAWGGGSGGLVDAVITEPAWDRTVANGTCVPFQALVRGGPGRTIQGAWDFGDGDTGTGLACEHTFRNPGPGIVVDLATFTATDDRGAQGTDTRQITVLPPPPPGELIANGGFELGKGGWNSKGFAIGDNRPYAPACDGIANAWFSGRRAGGRLSQRMTIPAQAASPKLTFWLQVSTLETSLEALDCLKVKVRGADGRLADLAAFSNLDAGLGYQQQSLDLRAYRGQRIQLSFVADPPAGDRMTQFSLDDVSVIAM